MTIATLGFATLLLTAQREALETLRAIAAGRLDIDAPFLRERRLAATAILKLALDPSPFEAEPRKRGKSNIAEHAHRPTPSLSGGGQGRAAKSDSADFSTPSAEPRASRSHTRPSRPCHPIATHVQLTARALRARCGSDTS